MQQASNANELLDSARIEFQNGRFDRAAAFLLAATNAHERMLGVNSVQVLEGLEMLGDSYFAMGKFDDAAATYQRLVEITERQPQPAYLTIAQLLVKIAKCFEQSRNNEVAQYCYDQALNVCETRLPPKHPFTTQVLEKYVGFLKTIDADTAKIHAMERTLQQLTVKTPEELLPAENSSADHLDLVPHVPKLRARDFKQSTMKQMAIDDIQGMLRNKWLILSAVIFLAVVLWCVYVLNSIVPATPRP